MRGDQSPESILEEALELPEPLTRASFLDEACRGDVSLREEIESLLAAHLEADAFMNTVADPRWKSLATAHEGDHVGRYLLVKKIAEGGFGVVFQAEQQEPVRRMVALKVIKPGMDSKEVVSRFELERQALAMMDHPNIAKVHDAGTTERGHPYFVMELVDGTPLTRFCDEHHLDIRARLKLFAQICIAIQHAHQKGIIHRDLKPSNILVGESEDGSPVPKVIDFGVAKAVTPELTPMTLLTMHGRMMGTPRYMSPEQAELNKVDVDTRSDIYSLGVILYELMTGRAPLPDKQMNSASFDEVRRMIQEHEPATPSDRINSLTRKERGEAARARQTDDGKLCRQLSGDLDWIIMKALEKDRSRRYDTAQGLAVDVRRYLSGLPVGAGPPGAAYRFGKFVRRNRWPVAMAGLALLTLIALMVSIVLGYFVLRADRDQLSERESKRVQSLADGVGKVRRLRANVSGSRAEALRILGEIGLFPKEEIVRLKGEATAQKLRSDARNELIACLLWTDLHESPLLKELKSSWPPAALDSSNVHFVLSRREGQLEVIRATTGKRLAIREGLGGPIDGPLRFNRKGDLVAAGSGGPANWNIMVWNWAEDRIVAEGIPGLNAAFDFHPAGDGFAVGTREQTVKLYATDGTARGEPIPLPGEPVVMRFSPDGRSLATSVKDAGIMIIDLISGEKQALGTTMDCLSLDWAPHGQAVVAGTQNGSVTVLERDSGRETFSVSGHSGPVDQIAWSHDGLLIASGSQQEGAIHLWDSRQGELLCKFPAWSRTLCFSQDDRSLGPVTPATDEHALSILEVQRSPVCHRTAGHTADAIAAAVWNPDGTVLATAAEDGVRFWNRNGAQLEHFPDDQVESGGLFFSPTHLYLAEPAGISRRSIELSDGHLKMGSKAPFHELTGARQINLSSDGHYLAVAHDAGVALLDAKDGAELRQLRPPNGTTGISSLAISPDGTWVAAGTRKGSLVWVWRLDETGEMLQGLPVDGGATVAFCPLTRHPFTGKALTILMTGDSKTYQQWVLDPGNGKFQPKRSRPSKMADRLGRTAHIVYSPRGTALAVSFDRKYLQVLNPLTLDIMTQPGFEEQWPLVISPDGRIMTNEAANGRLFLWNLAEVRREMELRGLDWDVLPAFPRDTIPLVAPGRP